MSIPVYPAYGQPAAPDPFPGLYAAFAVLAIIAVTFTI